MKMIKITTENQISVHDFPEGSFEAQNEAIREHIGPKCELYEHVMPRRLYSELHASGKRGNGVSMLVDEDGYYHNLPENIVASDILRSRKKEFWMKLPIWRLTRNGKRKWTVEKRLEPV